MHTQTIELPKLARFYRRLTLAVVAQLLLPVVISSLWGKQPEARLVAICAYAFLAGAFVATAATLYYAIRTALVLRSWSTWIAFGFMLIPFVVAVIASMIRLPPMLTRVMSLFPLVGLLGISAAATARFRTAGIRVGLLGPADGAFPPKSEHGHDGPATDPVVARGDG